LSALAFPPFKPPNRPRATAAAFFSGSGLFVLMSITRAVVAIPLLCLSGLAYARVYDSAMTTEILTIGERIARLIDAEANRVPDSHKAQRDILREQAKNFREHVTGDLLQPWSDVG
jgi:hypothetical protein